MVAAIMRIGLALQGGQYFFHDEGRYSAGVTLYQAVRHGDWAALGAQLMRPEHAAFNYLNMLVAAVHHALAQFTAYGDWTVEPNIAATAQLAAAVLALFSVLNIWLGPPAGARRRGRRGRGALGRAARGGVQHALLLLAAPAAV